MYYYGTYYGPNELYHYGVKGMKWGVRRYQNEDGSLKTAGQRHRAETEGTSSSSSKSRGSSGSKKSNRSKKIKKALGITLGAAAAAGLAYGGRKLYKSGKLYDLKAKYHGAKADYFRNGGASGLANRLGGKMKNKANIAKLRGQTLVDKGRSAVARGKQKYYENGGSISNMARRKWTTSGGARGIASGVTGRAKSAAKYYGGKASDIARSVGTKASVASTRAKSALNSAKNRGLIKYYDTKTKYYNAGGASGIGRSVAGKATSVASRAASGLGRGVERGGRAVNATTSRLRSELAARGGVKNVAKSAAARVVRKRKAKRATLTRF